MLKFGQRVRCKACFGSVAVGETGTVVYYSEPWTGVAWDTYDVDKHNCDGRCDDGYGYYIPEGYLAIDCYSVIDINEFI